MVQDTIEKIGVKIGKINSLSEKDKHDLLNLLARLKSEMAVFSESMPEQAESITGFMERSANEVIKEEKNPDLIKISLDGLSASVKRFETSHPELVENVNYIATALANMGI